MTFKELAKLISEMSEAEQQCEATFWDERIQSEAFGIVELKRAQNYVSMGGPEPYFEEFEDGEEAETHFRYVGPERYDYELFLSQNAPYFTLEKDQ